MDSLLDITRVTAGVVLLLVGIIGYLVYQREWWILYSSRGKDWRMAIPRAFITLLVSGGLLAIGLVLFIPSFYTVLINLLVLDLLLSLLGTVSLVSPYLLAERAGKPPKKQ